MILFLYVFALGLCFGSFVNVLVWRLPNNISITGRSFCPKCKKKITWYDNIPLLSFIFLHGKCRYCGKKISIRYPIIELTGGIGFILISYYLIYIKGFLDINYGLINLSYLLAVYIILLSIFIIDLEHQLIPDSLVFAGIALVLLYSILFNQGNLLELMFSGFLSALFLLMIHIFTRGRGMGLGDVKFAIFGGMFVGLKLMPVWLFLAFLTGGITGIILIISGKAKMKTKIAFGPFLVAGIFLTFLFSDVILKFLSFR